MNIYSVKRSGLILTLLISVIYSGFLKDCLCQNFPITNIPCSPPRSGYESPAMKTTSSLIESTSRSPKNLLTVFEKTNYLETGQYAETLEFFSKLEKQSPWIKVNTLGKTPEGRDLVLAVLSKDSAFTPNSAAKTGKPIVLIQNGIHAGEIAGKDATMMLLRDILITKKYASWLDKVIILVIPVFNVDGHERISSYNRINQNGPREMGFRTTAQRYNLNRDFIKADAPETRAWLHMYTQWLPHFFIDNHVTDGADYQYDLGLKLSSGPEIWPAVGNWVKNKFLPELDTAMEKNEHVVGPYIDPIDEKDISKGLSDISPSPRYAATYTSTRNRVGMLVETHSLKSYRVQAWAHYDLMRYTFDILSKNPKALVDSIEEADVAVASMGKEFNQNNKLYLDGIRSERSEPFLFKGVESRLEKSNISGNDYIIYGSKPVEIQTHIFNQVTTTVAPVVPLAYIIPRQWTSIIDLLKIHGIRTEELKKDITGDFETYYFTEPKWSEFSFEGRLFVNFKSHLIQKKFTVLKGSILVPMDQRAARVILNILEPDGPDSAIRWGFLNSIFEQKEYFSDYVMEPIAREMLEKDPKLRAEFEKQLNSDSKFAADPNARLNFFYFRSPYCEQDKGLYPVLRVIQPLAR